MEFSEVMEEAFRKKRVWERAIKAWNNKVIADKSRLISLIHKERHTKEERKEFDSCLSTIKLDSVLNEGTYKTEMYGFKRYRLIREYLMERVHRQEFACSCHRDIDRYARHIGPSRLMERVARWLQKNPKRIVEWSDEGIYLRKWNN